MAIYSCNLRSIGRSTHTAGTAGAHIRYIARDDADPVIVTAHMPEDHREARTWMDQRERALRKNARVIDKLRIALPRELNREERAALVRDFMTDLTGNRLPWFAAIHQTGKDAHNPHVHIAVHDRTIDSGERLLRLSDSARDRRKAGLPGPQAVQWIRERWEAAANGALARAGHTARIDRRTLEAQGIDRQPTIHEGPRAQHINDNVRRPDSRPRTNGLGRVIDYPAIDRGKTRREFNAHIIDLALERAARSTHPDTAAWAQFEKMQRAEDRALEERLASERHERTAEMRNTARTFTAEQRRVRAEWRLKARAADSKVRECFQPRREELRRRQHEDRAALRRKHRGFMARIARRLSRRAKERQLAERQEQIAAHKAERKGLSRHYKAARTAAQAGITLRFQPRIEAIRRSREARLAELAAAHRDADRRVDEHWQERERDREQARRLTEERIAARKKERKETDSGKPPTSKDFDHAAHTPPEHSEAMRRAIEKVERRRQKREERNKNRPHGRPGRKR